MKQTIFIQKANAIFTANDLIIAKRACNCRFVGRMPLLEEENIFFLSLALILFLLCG